MDTCMRWRARAPNIAISVRIWLAYFIYSYEALPVASGPRIRKSAAAQNLSPAGLRKGFFHIPIWLLSVAHHNFTMRTAMYSLIQPSSLKFYRLPPKPLIGERNSGVTARGCLH